ncbi:MAG TPA: WD40 repeat domain-containing protein [Gemmataceae bacterium]|nr:WD40 repeat domain-containing protein [Gemmataceae bacterium]
MWASVLCLLLGPAVLAQAPRADEVLPGEKQPVLRLEAGGPTSRVTSLAFGPDGTLYAGTWDKVVRAWTRDDRGTFHLGRAAYRVPIGPGLAGAINAVAVAPDGKWLAAAGHGAMRGAATFREDALWVDLSDIPLDMRRDQGLIYVFHTGDLTVRRLRGHTGPVLALAFVQESDGRPVLVSVARDWDEKKRAYVGGVRLWDASKWEPLADRSDLPDPFSPEVTTAGLAAWRVGPQPAEVRVVLALGGDRIHIWDAARNEVVSERCLPDKDPKVIYSNYLAAYLGGGQVMTACFDATPRHGDGWLLRWDATRPALARERSLSFREEKTYYYPRALTPFAATGKGPPDHVAAVFWVRAGAEVGYVLRILNLKTLETIRWLRLWGGQESVPVLAASPDGKHLAAAGNEAHEVHIYAIADLLDPKVKAPQPQRQHSIGATLRYAAFIRKGKERGLLLSEAPKAAPGAAPRGPAKGDLILNLNTRILTADPEGWKPDATDMPRGVVEYSPPTKEYPREYFRVRPNGKWVALKTGQQMTDYALLPARPGQAVPILALAYRDEHGQPRLSLFNGLSGKQVRELTGHVGTIRSLTFSADGKFLVSAADDQTVCLWGLDDLNLALGQRGLLRGVRVEEKADNKGGVRLVVTWVARDSLAHGKLKEGDVILGLVEEGKPVRFDSATAFFDSVGAGQPGSTVTLQLADRREAVILEAAVDERKPRLSLFVTGPPVANTPGSPRAEERDWIAWRPHGFYDASGRKAEQWLGWLIGTDKPERPTSFVLAEQHRKEYYQEDLFERVLVGPRPPPPPPPPLRPRLGLWIDEVGPDPNRRDPQGHFVVRQRRVTLKLAARDLTLDQVASAAWQAGTAAPREFDSVFGMDAPEWWADLTPHFHQAGWPRTPFAVRAVLRTNETTPQEFPELLTVRYEPAPPVITLKAPEAAAGGTGTVRKLSVGQRAFPLHVQAGPAVEGEKVRLRLTHTHSGKTLFDSGEQEGSREVKANLNLGIGLNRVEVVAWNEGRAKEGLEESRLVLEVDFEPKVPPVQITLRAVVPVTGRPLDDQAPDVRLIETGRVVTVPTPRVRIEGEIKAALDKDKLTRAVWSRDEEKPQELKGFAAGRHQTFAVGEVVRLVPGRQKVRFLAESELGKDAKEVELDYQPPPPDVFLKAPPPRLYEGEHQGDLQLEVELEPPLDPEHAYEGLTATALVTTDGQEIAARKQPIGRGVRSFTVGVPVQPGKTHTVKVRLGNKWQSKLSSPFVVAYLRPPREIAFDPVPQPVQNPVIDLSAQVKSALPVTRVVADIRGGKDGRTVPILDSEIIPPKEKQGVQTYTVRLRGVALSEGINEVSLLAANDEAWSLHPAVQKIEYRRPLIPPTITLLDPVGDPRTVRAPRYTLRFQVESKQPLTRIAVLRQRQVIAAPQVAALKRNAKGVYEVEQEVPLVPGVNDLEIVAASPDGESRVPVQLSTPALGVWVDILGLQPSAGGPLIPPVVSGNGQVLFPQVPDGRLRLFGRVHFLNERDDKLRRDDLLVQVRVNGFQQLPARLLPPPSNRPEREFQADIVLNKEAGNRVELELPGLKLEADNAAAFEVLQCAQPVKGRWLHLLIVAVGERDEKKLGEQFLEAVKLQAAGGPPGTAFDRVEIYGPLVNDLATADRVEGQLRKMKFHMEQRAREGSPNDVALVYYYGGQEITERGHFLHTNVRRSPLPCAKLEAELRNAFGAQVVFLDVWNAGSKEPPPGKDLMGRWLKDPRLFLVVFRSAWMAGKEPSPEARLSYHLARLMPQAENLGDLDNRLDKVYQGLSPDNGPAGLNYQSKVPEPLKDLELNRKEVGRNGTR